VFGKPTIGYGITDENIIRKGIISDDEAKQLVINRIKHIYKHLNAEYPVFKTLNPNQKTALISFCYNLGTHFIENGTEKMEAHLRAGNLNRACYEMHDCNKVKQDGVYVQSTRIN
jgi:GH24 family phage-related lysozyme (muramidase)